MTDNNYVKRHFDVWILFTTILLVGIGTIMNYSASAVLAQERYNDSYFFLKRTLFFASGGLTLLVAALHIDYHYYRRFVYPIFFCALFLSALTFVPGIGRKVSGATRWISFGFFYFQPSELMKLAMVIFLSYSLEKKIKKIKSFGIGVLPHLVILGVVCGAILMQKDLGAAAIIAIITWILIFVAGGRLSYLLSAGFALIPVLIWLIAGEGYRKRRILSFLNPWNDQLGSGFQMIQSYVAFSEGKILGRGLGQGQQKLFYLPEAHTDFIFSVIGEELGMLGVLTVILLFSFFFYRGIRVVLNAPDLFGKFLALGCTLLIALCAFLNMSVVLGMLPTKGLALPFISYGGSSLIVSLLAVGILLNVSSYEGVEM